MATTPQKPQGQPQPSAPATSASQAAEQHLKQAALAKRDNNTDFKKTLTVFDMVIYGMIFMVPIAPFAIYASVYDASGGLPLLAYLVAGIGMIFTVFSFGVMIDLFPSSGSIFTYASKAVGPGLGFVSGWLMLLQYLITPAVMFMQAGEALNQYLPQVPVWAWCLIFLVFVLVIATRGMGATMVVDRIALVAEVIVFGLFIVLGIVYIVNHPATSGFTFNAVFDPKRFDFGAVMSAVSLCALSYVGFGSVATLTEEAKDSEHGPSRSMMIIVLLLILMFCGMCFVATCVSPDGSMFSKPGEMDNGFYLLAAQVGGAWFGVLCAVANALALGLFTALAGVTSVSRILFAMGRAGSLPKRFGTMGKKKTQIPMFATLFTVALSLVLIFALIPVGMDTAAKFSNYGALSTYCILNVCVIWYCWIKVKEHRNPVRHLILPALGALVTGAIFFSLGGLCLIVGTVWAAIGIAYYLYMTKVKHHAMSME